MQRNIILTWLYLLSIASGSPIIRILFNNGIALPNNQTCNYFDNYKIDAALKDIGSLLRRHRQLRVQNENKSHEHQDRKLWPAYCKNNCAGFPQNMCRAVGCIGYRRELGDVRGSKSDNRDLLSCADQISEVNQVLNYLVANKTVSSSCRAVLQSPRNMTCYDDSIHGEIEYVNVFDLRNVTTLNSTPGNIKSLCKSSVYFVDIHVNSCVDYLETVLTAPNGKVLVSNSTISFPYFGVVDGNLLNQTGVYNLTATPDGVVDKKSTVSFQIRSC
jgi:hypothetical protein